MGKLPNRMGEAMVLRGLRPKSSSNQRLVRLEGYTVVLRWKAGPTTADVGICTCSPRN